jgi:LCP family protein required for cell wall assembly
MVDSYADRESDAPDADSGDGNSDTHGDTSEASTLSTLSDTPLAPSGNSAANQEVKSGSSDNQETLIRRRKRRKRKHKGLRVAAIVLAALVVMGAGIVWAALGAVQSGGKAIGVDIEKAQVSVGIDAVTEDEGKTVFYNGHKYVLNENIISLVFIGFDRFASSEEGEPAGQADTIIVMAFDTQSGKVTAISVPRDSMIDVSEFASGTFPDRNAIQLCLTFSYGDGGTTSCENTVTAVSRILYNIPITYYFALNESGIAVLNDAIGGVSLTPLQTVPNTNIVEGESTVLFGYHAYRYVQWRDTSELNSSIDRQARQMQYIKAFAAQALQLSEGSAGTMLDLYSITADYSITNLGVNEFSYLTSVALANNITSLDMVTLSGDMVQGEVYAEYYLDKDAVYKTILDVYYRRID